MALATTIDWDTGARIISSRATRRNLRETAESYFNLEEVNYEETREANAVARASAVTIVTAASQTGLPGTYDVEAYSYEQSEDDRVTGSSTVRRTFTGKSITFV